MTPTDLKDAFVNAGYSVYFDDDDVSVLGMCDDDDPLLLPKIGHAVAEDVLRYAISHARLNGRHKEVAAALGIPEDMPEPPRVATRAKSATAHELASATVAPGVASAAASSSEPAPDEAASAPKQ
ncbi:MAG TPA: hypothetical protein VHK47_02045 [Polyangia bacterium]|nr:hypothetical protein [Polyangia bacterium]